jgi:hypothetical protein
VLASLYSIKMLYLMSLLIMTKIKSNLTPVISSFDLGNLTIKSINTNCYALSSTLICYSILIGLCLTRLLVIYC